MKDEIKEILDNINDKWEAYYVQDIVSGNDLKRLLDYITNLQEENERLIRIKKFYKNSALNNFKEKADYKARIDKAIETIELWDMCGSKLITTFQEKAINILQGKSDE